MLACSCGQGRPNLTADWDGIPRTASAKCLLLTPSPGSTRRMQTPAPGAAHGGGPRPLRQQAGAGLLRRERKLPRELQGQDGGHGEEPTRLPHLWLPGGWEAPLGRCHVPCLPCRAGAAWEAALGFISTAGSAAVRLCSLPAITQVSVCDSDSHSHPERTDFSSRLLTPPISLTHPATRFF